jgi:hypothetical protein
MASNIDFEIESCSKHFDPGYYKGEIMKAGINVADNDLCKHFCTIGWHMALDPCRWFSVESYLKEYGDILSANINPFFHYIVQGESEGRTGGLRVNKFEHVIDLLKPLTSLKEEALFWKKQILIKSLYSQDELKRKILSDSGIKKSIVLSISHDNYKINPGGVQVSIKREEAFFVEAGITYLHIYPLQPLPKLSNSSSALFLVGLILDGKFLGEMTLVGLFKVLSSAKLKTIILHSMLAFNLDLLGTLMKSMGNPKVYYWAHDYFPFCESWTLTRNKVKFCGCPEAGSGECQICYYGTSRESHLNSYRKFLSRNKVNILCPSEDAKGRYIELAHKFKYPYESIKTIEHYKFVSSSFKNKNFSGVIRIAFLGHPAQHKGWFDFTKLFYSKNLANICDFYHMGPKVSPLGHGITSIPVNTSIDGDSAMTDAVKGNAIDLCVLWSNWPETFGITFVEAIQGEALVATSSCSGNISHMVKQLAFGVVFDEVEELERWIIEHATEKAYEKLKFPFQIEVEKSKLTFEEFSSGEAAQNV